MPADLEETKILPFKALQVALKYWMLKSIIMSKYIIPKNMVVKGTLDVPAIHDLYKKSFYELRNLAITEV